MTSTIIVGTAEIADRLGVRTMTVHQWRQRPRLEFPEPDWQLAMGPVWRWETIEQWATSHGRLK